MRLAWHIAKKDFRRFALPVAGWLILVVGPAVVLSFSSPAIVAHAPSEIDAWSRLYAIWLRLIEAMQWVIGFVLGGTLVLEDPLVGTTHFWLSRPIAKSRLMVAKILAAAVLLVGVPIVAFTGVWLVNGFGANELGRAGADTAARLGAGALCAVMVASLARSLAQFLFFGVVLTAGVLAVMFLPAPFAVRSARYELLMLAGLPIAAIATAHQFLTRQSERTWAILACALVAAAVVPAVRPLRSLAAGNAPRAGAPRPGDRSGDIVTASAFTQHQANSVPSLYGRTTWRPEGFVAPVYVRAADGAFVMRGAEMWASGAALRTLGFVAATEPLRWQVSRIGWRPSGPGGDQLVGGLEAWAVRTRVLGEMPVRIGAELRHDAECVRIIGLLSNEGRLDNIYLQARTGQAEAERTWTRNWSLRQAGRARQIDCYVLIGGSPRQAQASIGGELGTVETGSLALRFFNLRVSWPHDRGEAVLVKVRFEREHAFEIPLEVNGVTKRGFEQTP